MIMAECWLPLATVIASMLLKTIVVAAAPSITADCVFADVTVVLPLAVESSLNASCGLISFSNVTLVPSVTGVSSPVIYLNASNSVI